MKFNFKKISAIVASTLMAGMTLGVAAAAAYPAPFIQGGTANVAIVYGTGAGVSSLDLVQAGNIQSNLQSRMGSTTPGSATDSDQQKSLMTSNRKLYYGDSINAPIPSLSATELPNVLEDGTFTDLTGVAYDYTQTITIGDTVSAFSTSSGDLDDPVILLDVGSTAADGLYNYTLSFTKNVNVSDATNVQGQKIEILGVQYVIGTGSTENTLYLYGSGETISLLGGESTTVNIAGTEHTVELITTTSTTTARISVDGSSRDVVQGSSYAFPGDLNVFVKSVTNPQFQDDLREVELIMGANTLKLVNTATVKTGADLTSIKGTLATISGGAAGTGEISSIKVSVAMQKSSEDHLALGESFTDPVFGGLKVKLADVNPALDSIARAKIVVDTDNNQFAYVTFTSARAGTAGEQKLTYAYDNDTLSTLVSPKLAHQTLPSTSKGLIHVKEGANAQIGDWIVINQGDSGTILEVDDISVNTALSGTVTFVDVITGASQTVTLANNTVDSVYTKSGVNFFGGTGYNISVDGISERTVNITWDGATATTLFPRIKLANGGWIAFLTATNVTSGISVILPDGATTIDTTGDAFAVANGFNAGVVVNEGMTWNWTNVSTSMEVNGLANSISSVCNFNSSFGPAILYMEPKKWNDGTQGDWICIPMTTTGATEIAISRPLLNSTNSGFNTLTSDTYMQQAIDKYGVLVSFESRTNENGRATLAIPSSQMFLDVIVAEESADVSTGGDTTDGTTQLGDILVKDSEVGNVAAKNLIIVGGSCINSAAAALVGGAKCGPSWYEATGAGSGQFIIKGYATSTLTSKLALLVAGYDAADTVNAATYLRTKTVDTSKEYLGTSATSATLVTTEA